MKTSIKVFSVLRIVGYALVSLLCIYYVVIFFGTLGLSDEDFASRAQKYELTITKSDVSLFGIVFLIVLIYAVICIIISALTLKKVSEPLEKKPVVYGILNIIFCGILTGIFLLCLEPVKERPSKI